MIAILASFCKAIFALAAVWYLGSVFFYWTYYADVWIWPRKTGSVAFLLIVLFGLGIWALMAAFQASKAAAQKKQQADDSSASAQSSDGASASTSADSASPDSGLPPASSNEPLGADDQNLVGAVSTSTDVNVLLKDNYAPGPETPDPASDAPAEPAPAPEPPPQSAPAPSGGADTQTSMTQKKGGEGSDG